MDDPALRSRTRRHPPATPINSARSARNLTDRSGSRDNSAARGSLPPRAERRAIAQQRGQRGFTLIEMIVVLVILGLTLGLVVSRGPLHSRGLNLDAAARQVAASLQRARSRAIALDRPVRWVVANNRFAMDGEAAKALPGDVDALRNGVIGFAPDGSSTGGQVVLRAGSRQVAIGVDWLSGRVHLASTE